MSPPTNPQAVSTDRLDPAAVERERAIYAEQARTSRQAREHHRQDGRGPAAQVLRGGRAARAGLRDRHRQAGQGSRSRLAGQGARRSGSGRRLRAMALGEGVDRGEVTILRAEVGAARRRLIGASGADRPDVAASGARR